MTDGVTRPDDLPETHRVEPEKPYPRVLQATILLLLLITLATLLSVPIAIVSNLTGYPLMDHPATLSIVNSIAFALVLLFGLKKTRAARKEVFPFTTIPLGFLLPMTLTILGMSILLSEFDNLFRTYLPIPENLVRLFENLLGGRKNPFWSIVALVIVAPVTEELMFRGLILRGFLRGYSVTTAILASALLFGLIHLNPWQFFGALVFGILLGWWRLKTGSLLPCLFGHALNNALPAIIGAILPWEIPGYTTEISRAIIFQPLWLDVLGATLTGIGIFVLAQKFNAHKSGRGSSGARQ